MLLIRLLTFIKGFVRVSVAGKFTERFLNICMNRDIYVWNIKKRGEELLHLNLTVEGFKNIPPVASKSRTKVRIVSRHGLPFVIAKYKKRKAFYVGGIIFVILFIYITSFVWSIEVIGNEKVSSEHIVAVLEKNGFKNGKFRYGNDITSLQNKMLLDIKELSWLWVDIKGTRAIVEVKEKVPIPEIVDKKQPCNIVAKTDGLITEINATYGQRVVKVGEVVKKGDLLISGISNTKYDGIHYLHSSGEVKARTWRVKTAEIPLVKTNFSETDKKISKNTINLFGFGVKLYLKEDVPFEYNREETVVHKLRLGENLVFPVSLERRMFYELKKEEEPITTDTALEICSKKLYAELDSELSPQTEVINRNCVVVNETEESIVVKAEYECIEEIGAEALIQKEQ